MIFEFSSFLGHPTVQRPAVIQFRNRLREFLPWMGALAGASAFGAAAAEANGGDPKSLLREWSARMRGVTTLPGGSTFLPLGANLLLGGFDLLSVDMDTSTGGIAFNFVRKNFSSVLPIMTMS